MNVDHDMENRVSLRPITQENESECIRLQP
jgi:hypothetical protein